MLVFQIIVYVWICWSTEAVFGFFIWYLLRTEVWKFFYFERKPLLAASLRFRWASKHNRVCPSVSSELFYKCLSMSACTYHEGMAVDWQWTCMQIIANETCTSFILIKWSQGWAVYACGLLSTGCRILYHNPVESLSFTIELKTLYSLWRYKSLLIHYIYGTTLYKCINILGCLINQPLSCL